MLDFLEDAAEQMSRGIAPPPATPRQLDAVYIPKGEFDSDLERVIHRIKDLRPITLMQTSAKLIASVVNEDMSSIVKRTVAGEQRGFVEGLAIGGNIVEMGSARFEHSQLLDSMPATVVFNFAQASPSLARRWIWRVLEAMGVNSHLIATIRCLYADLVTLVFYNSNWFH